MSCDVTSWCDMLLWETLRFGRILTPLAFHKPDTTLTSRGVCGRSWLSRTGLFRVFIDLRSETRQFNPLRFALQLGSRLYLLLGVVMMVWCWGTRLSSEANSLMEDGRKMSPRLGSHIYGLHCGFLFIYLLKEKKNEQNLKYILIEC